MVVVDRDTLHQALECLYDNVGLVQTELAGMFVQIADLPTLDERAEAFRSIVLEAIEALRPRRVCRFGSLQSRSYDVLTLRYVEGMDILQMEEELSLGRRQIYRDLQEAETKLAEILASWLSSGHQPATTNAEDDSLSDELLRLAGSPSPVILHELLAEACETVLPLAERLGLAIRISKGHEPVAVTADRAILKQVLTQLLSYAVQASSSSVVEVSIRTETGQAKTDVLISFAGRISEDHSVKLAAVQRIAFSQGISCSVMENTPGEVAMELILPQKRVISVMVVEDNPGALELYRRYLAFAGWQVHGISDSRVAADVARRTQPNIIVLDIMMPKQNGWSVLQSIKQDEATAGIPIVICSVVDDPQLAMALGAEEYLTKPVPQGEFLAALYRCLTAKPHR